MAKAICVLLCVYYISIQTVLCQFGFFPQRQNNGNFLDQAFQQGHNVIRNGLGGLFHPNRQRNPVRKPTQDTIYVIETDMPVNQNNRPNVIYIEEQNSGNVRFPGNSNGFRPNQGNQGFQPNRGNEGFRPTQTTESFLPNAGNEGFQPNQGNENIQPTRGNDGTQPNEDAVNFGNDDVNQNPNNGANQMEPEQTSHNPTPDNDPVNIDEVPKVPETTTLAPLTPVPEVKTESRNNFNFGSSSGFAETCDTADGGVGTCISLYDCPQYLKLAQEAGNKAAQVLRRAHCGFEGNAPKVCCPFQSIPTAPPPTPSSSSTTTTTTAAPQPEVPSSKNAMGDFIAALPDPPECGLSNASFSRVVGGVNAKLGDFPWMALLGYKSRRGGFSWLCGGSLVSRRHVLTAAHCIHNHENDLYVVRLGELDLAKEDEGATPRDVVIKQMIKHKEYSASAFTNDIGILVLSEDVEFTDLIRPICIPKDSELRARSFEDYNPLIAGWGHTEFRGPSATHLQVLQLPVVSNEFCAAAYAPYKAQTIDARVLCAGFKKGGKDACQGDSGGPLMQPIWIQSTYQTYFYQIGVVSYGKKCAEAGFPGVYSRITHFASWIEEQVLGHTAR